jgi:hypothetical protein
MHGNRYASTAAVAILLAGCGGSQPPIGAPGAMPQSRAIAQHLARGKSWMLPEARANNLLYVSTNYDGVYVFSYPSGNLQGILSPGEELSAGMCVDRNGDVFMTDTRESIVLEYAHGGAAPKATLYGPPSDFSPLGCSVDPMTGNLAVTNADSVEVMIFKRARGKPRIYSDPQAIMEFCTYDNKGNLYVDQIKHGRASYIGELARGSATFKNLKLDANIGAAGGVQWDGKYVVVDSFGTNVISRVRISNSHGAIVGTTPLTGSSFIRQFWIQGRDVIGADENLNQVGFWKYPAGGSPTKSILGIDEPFAPVVSLAPHR